MGKVLRIFEAFAGIGSQRMALKNLNINYKSVGIAEIDIDAIISYGHIHEDVDNFILDKNDTEMIRHLKDRQIGCNSKTGKSRLDGLKTEKLKKLYKSSIVSNNFGDISTIDPQSIPDHDLFTYSFPCQDISTVGTRLSLAENSGTRSSLLWESKKIIETKKPKYLMLENVRNLAGPKNIKYFELWLDWLMQQGYKNYWDIIDSQHFGIPQRRERVFVVSILGDQDFIMPQRGNKEHRIIDFLELDHKYTNFYNLKKLGKELEDIKVKKFEILDGEVKFWDDRDWKMNGIMIQDVCPTQRAGRSGIKCVKREEDTLKVRKLTVKECWRLMGFSDTDYYKAVKSGVTKTQLLKQSGNAIVVKVLEAIFTNLFQEYIIE